MTIARDLAAFAVRASFSDLTRVATDALKIRILDSLGCAFGALGAPPLGAVRALVDELGGTPRASLVGGGRTAPDRAAFYNGALVRYLDFNDAYLAPGETCHPSDCLAPVLAAAEAGRADGRTLLTALAIAYQVQCRLSDVAPVRARGFDHTTQGSCAVAAGVARALGLDVDRATNAIAIAATIAPALRVTRTGSLSHWKGLAFPHASFAATHAALLAQHGVTGPSEAFEGNKGFMDTLSGRFSIDWSAEGLDRVTGTSTKRYNAEVHAQSAVEAVVELAQQGSLAPGHIKRIVVRTFGVARAIIGGGEEGDKSVVRTKEEADHSLPYMVAVAAIDGRLGPEQYAPERIVRADVQELLHRVEVVDDADLSERFPRELPCVVRMELAGGRVVERSKRDYLGFATRPASWDDARGKFERLARRLTPDHRRRVLEVVSDLEARTTADLAATFPMEVQR